MFQLSEAFPPAARLSTPYFVSMLLEADKHCHWGGGDHCRSLVNPSQPLAPAGPVHAGTGGILFQRHILGDFWDHLG